MKLHIFGASGTGVSTLGRVLGEALGIPYFDSDEYFWEHTDPPFTVRRPPAERNAALAKELAPYTSWVLGGSIVGWSKDWLKAFDLVIFLWLPPALRLQRLRQREYERYGNIIFTDPARSAQYRAFLDWAAGYDDNSTGGHRTMANHIIWLSQFNCPILELRGDLSVGERKRSVQTKLSGLGLS